ncbi:MAG TPA: 16S rRNA (cytosine(1402)-N(4))-methyltransferase RsmH [Bacillota bacterium]
MSTLHEPVLVGEVLHYLAPRPGGIYVDGTVGAGGHSDAILEAVDGRCRLIGIDRDPEALAAARRVLARWGEAVQLAHANYAGFEAVLDDLGIGTVDGFLLDLGVSSLQLDRPERGFSYQQDAPLDMRMDQTGGPTAADLLNRLDAGELTRILREYGEERWAARIAAFIVDARQRDRIATTAQLEAVIKAAIPAAARRRGGHPARRTFQALRIAVNDELGALSRVIEPAARRLAAGGRLVIISFHSLEDRIVKRWFQRLSRGCACPPGAECRCGGERILEVLTRRPVKAAEHEVRRNPRARSAKLRAARRIAATGRE